MDWNIKKGETMVTKYSITNNDSISPAIFYIIHNPNRNIIQT